jgi:alanine-synthesizing transaminase
MNRIEQTRQRLVKAGRKIFNLSSGNPNEFGIYFDRAVLKQVYENFLKTPAYEPDPKGSLAARKAAQKFYASRGLKLDAEQIILTSGSSESYFHLFRMLAKPGEKILFPKPSYPLFEEIARLAEVEIAFYSLDENDGWQIDCENLESKIRPDVKAIVLISPSNPTGAVLHKDTLQKVAAIAAKHNLPIISDEVFSEYVFDGKDFPRMSEIAQKTGKNQPTVFTLNGLSKTYALPGLKLSWVVVTGATFEVETTVEQLERSADAFLACNQVSQAMAPEIIKKGQPFIKELNRHLQKNRDLAVKILGANPDITFHIPEGGFYMFVHIRRMAAGMKPAEGNRGRGPVLPEDGFIPTAKTTDEDFVIALMEKTGIFVHPGYFYDYDKGINVLISLLPPQKVLTQKLNKIINSIPYRSGVSSRRLHAR